MSAKANAASSRQKVVLGGLLATLAIVALYQFTSSAPGSGTGSRRAARPAAEGGAAAGGQRGGKRAPGTLEDVALARLEGATWPEPTEGKRNPFSMAPDPPTAEQQAAAAAAAAKPADPMPAAPTGPPGPPPVPPIALKFIAVVSGPGRVGRIAALSDGKFVYHGREGQIVEGRYRIVKIGEESIQIEHADGRGRQTIRLSGK